MGGVLFEAHYQLFETMYNISNDVQLQKISTPTLRRVIGNSKMEGISKTKFLKESTKENCISRVGWVQSKKPLHGGGMDTFRKNTILLIAAFIAYENQILPANMECEKLHVFCCCINCWFTLERS